MSLRGIAERLFEVVRLLEPDFFLARRVTLTDLLRFLALLVLRRRDEGGLLDDLFLITINPLPSCRLVTAPLAMLDAISPTMFTAAFFKCGLAMLNPFLNNGTAILSNPRNMPPKPLPYCVLEPINPGNSPPAWFM